MQPLESVGGVSTPVCPLDLDASGNRQFHSLMLPTALLESSSTVQRRSSRPSSILSCDSLLAVRLQQEELWRPAKVKNHKPAPSFPVFSAHAASESTAFLHPFSGPGSNLRFKSSATVPSLVPASDSIDSGRNPSQNKGHHKRNRLDVSQDAAATLPKYGRRAPKFASSAPLLFHSCKRSRQPRKVLQDGSSSFPASNKAAQHTRKPPYHESFRENSRFFYSDVFKDEARALRVNGFPIQHEESPPVDVFDSVAIACLSSRFGPDEERKEDIEISDVLFVKDYPELSITFDMLLHPVHSSSLRMRSILSGCTRFRTFLDCSVGQLRDVLVDKMKGSQGVAGCDVESHHVKITFEGILLRDDVMLQELQAQWEDTHLARASLLQLTLYVCSPSEVWGAWQQHARPHGGT